jgi:hypothetical protein
MARVYLETSFFSACVSDRTDPRSVVRRVGYVPPEIVTPDAFWETEGE